MMVYKKIVFAAMLATASTALADNHEDSSAKELSVVQLSGISHMTHDADATAKFYIDMLDFKLHRSVVFDNEVTRAVYGLQPGAKVKYVVVMPSQWNKGDPYHSLSFAEIDARKNLKIDQIPERAGRPGETVFAFNVTKLRDIAVKMEAAGVPIVTPLAPSATGKSLTLTVLDPNGIRLQLYEYFK